MHVHRSDTGAYKALYEGHRGRSSKVRKRIPLTGKCGKNVDIDTFAAENLTGPGKNHIAYQQVAANETRS